MRDGLSRLTSLVQDLIKLLFCLTILIVITASVVDYYRSQKSFSLFSKHSSVTLNVKSKSFNRERIQNDGEHDDLLIETSLIKQTYFGFFVPPGNQFLPDVFDKEENPEHLPNETPKDSTFEESRVSYRKAKEVYAKGNKKMTKKLLQHALAFDETFVDALNFYGEVLEAENILKADMYYQRALENEPSHSTALGNRQRTSPMVKKIDQHMLMEIDSKKRELYKYPPGNPELHRAMKEFYYHHIYHTVALEGSSLSVEEIRAIIDSRMPVEGKTLVEHNEVIGIDEALRYLNNTLGLSLGYLSVDHIKEIHLRVMGFNDPINAAQFRSSQVFVGKHIPPHPNLVPQYMTEFMNWINSYEAMDLHPVELAAIAHYKLVFIHPFLDGNGRTSRLLMNFILMKYGFPPVSVQIQDRFLYYETLQAGNHGDLRPFIRFIAKCTANTLDDYLSAAKKYSFTYPELRDDHIIGN